MLESFKDNWGLRFLHSFHFGVVSPFQRSGVLFPKVWCPLSKGLVSPFQKHGVLFPKACESKHCRTLNAERRQCTLAKDGWNSQMTKYLTVNYSEKELSYYALVTMLPVFYCSVCQCASVPVCPSLTLSLTLHTSRSILGGGQPKSHTAPICTLQKSTFSATSSVHCSVLSPRLVTAKLCSSTALY